jgi:hypothetical protein
MAVSAAVISGSPDTIWGNKDVRPRRLTFSSNYATGGEAITASTFGLKKLEQLLLQGGVAAASDKATAIPVFYDQANSKLTFYEGSAAGTALSEKTNAEAYPTGCFLDVVAIGF